MSEARSLLRQGDPLRARDAFARVSLLDADAGALGLAETWLVMGRPGLAGRYIEDVRRRDPRRQDAIAVHVRILIRAAKFDRAVRMSSRAVARERHPSAELLAAHASALFRVQRTVDAAGVYQQVLRLDPLFPEAHLRLGSGLLPPRDAPFSLDLTRGIRAQQGGDLPAAKKHFVAALKRHPGHPVAHRLLGETLYRLRYESGMVASSTAYQALRRVLPVPSITDLPWQKFLPRYGELSPARRAVVARSLSLFRHLIPKLVKMRGRHDLLREDERTTDAPVRAQLRGTRTFDGRVWDDVRGIGGLRAATGIEALDDALTFEFDTLSHEIAHQAHLYAFTPLLRARVKRLYRDAMAAGRCLDFYAATNEAEYFGQGVEAFASLGKRPGCEKTHGHTRFELRRVDPELYEFIRSQVRFDPLADAEGRARILPLAIEVALQSGREKDAVQAAEMMDRGPQRDALLRRAERALLLSQTY